MGFFGVTRIRLLVYFLERQIEEQWLHSPFCHSITLESEMDIVTLMQEHPGEVGNPACWSCFDLGAGGLGCRRVDARLLMSSSWL
jgi:hypothetical protein